MKYIFYLFLTNATDMHTYTHKHTHTWYTNPHNKYWRYFFSPSSFFFFFSYGVTHTTTHKRERVPTFFIFLSTFVFPFSFISFLGLFITFRSFSFSPFSSKLKESWEVGRDSILGTLDQSPCRGDLVVSSFPYNRRSHLVSSI